MILLHNLQIRGHMLDTYPWYGNKLECLNRVCVYKSLQCSTKIYKLNTYKSSIPKQWVTKLVPIKSRLVNRMPYI